VPSDTEDDVEKHTTYTSRSVFISNLLLNIHNQKPNNPYNYCLVQI